MNRLLPSLALAGLWFVSSAALAAPGSGAVPGVASQSKFLLPLAHTPGEQPESHATATPNTAPAGGWRHFVRWVGHFHPPLTAFPIAMLLAAAVAEVLLLTKGPEWLRGGSRWCVIVGAITAAITAPLGWAFALERGGSRLLETHRWLGTAGAAGAVVLLVLSELSHRRDRPAWRVAFRTVLFLAVPLVIATAFYGGAMIYGTHAYAWNPPHAEDTHADADHDADHPAQAGTRPAGGYAVTVTMTDDDTFKPASITIAPGTTVRWENKSTDTHTVTTDPQAASDAKAVSQPSGARPFKSGKIPPGGKFEQTFTVPGTYKYVCEPHEEMDMKGTIVVQAP